MGAVFNIETVETQKSAREAFHDMYDQARAEHGYDPYNGTISTTSFAGVRGGPVTESMIEHQSGDLLHDVRKWETFARPLFEETERWSENTTTRVLAFDVPVETIDELRQRGYGFSFGVFDRGMSWSTDVLHTLAKHSSMKDPSLIRSGRGSLTVSQWDVRRIKPEADKKYRLQAGRLVEHFPTQAAASKRLTQLLRDTSQTFKDAAIVAESETVQRTVKRVRVSVEMEVGRRLTSRANPKQIGWAFFIGAAE